MAFIFGIFLLAACSASQSLNQNEAKQTTQNDIQNPSSFDGEGMWLLPQVREKVHPKMKGDGLSLSPSDIYHPDSASLNRAVVRIQNGQSLAGSGSFVSPQGLVLTNYNAIYSAITAESTAKQNYLKQGFYAESMASEIPLSNYVLYIPIEQREVTQQINDRLPDSLTYRKRIQQTQQIKKKLITERKGNQQNLTVSINDVWGGNRHVMSVYRVIQDVRLVHVPAEFIGSFGGNSDNWKWPRHSGDYAFVRAYVGPDGNSRNYSESNVPFNPDRHITVDTSGISRGDFTMTLGFSGQTSRHKSSYALEFYRDHQMPVIIEAYEAILDGLQHAADQDPKTALKNASQRASIAHTLTYYQSALERFKSQNVVEKTRDKETQFKQWIKQDSLRNIQYNRVLSQLDQAYNIASQTGDLLFGTVYALNNNRLFEIADIYHSYRQTVGDSTQQGPNQSYKDSLLTRHRSLLNDINVEAQQIMLSKMLHMLSTLPEGKVMFHLIKLFGDAQGDNLKSQIDQYLRKQQESIVYNLDKAEAFLNLSSDSVQAKPADDFIELYRALIENYQFSRKNYVQHIAYRDPAQELYVEGMQQFDPDALPYPDANGTLRLSTGHVTGYSPKDGVYHLPFTTFEGLQNRAADSVLHQELFIQKPDSTQNTEKLPVNFLSNNDITGGNEGSPVLNKHGDLVGIAYNSNLKAVSSDYYYESAIKRAVNVDIRYILFLLDRYDKTDRIQQELLDQTAGASTE